MGTDGQQNIYFSNWFQTQQRFPSINEKRGKIMITYLNYAEKKTQLEHYFLVMLNASNFLIYIFYNRLVHLFEPRELNSIPKNSYPYH